jgi:hypothetical protein
VIPTPYQGSRLKSYALHWHNGRWTSLKLPQGTYISDTADNELLSTPVMIS